jgi:hypothetical protein
MAFDAPKARWQLRTVRRAHFRGPVASRDHPQARPLLGRTLPSAVTRVTRVDGATTVLGAGLWVGIYCPGRGSIDRGSRFARSQNDGGPHRRHQTICSPGGQRDPGPAVRRVHSHWLESGGDQRGGTAHQRTCDQCGHPHWSTPTGRKVWRGALSWSRRAQPFAAQETSCIRPD